MRLRLDPWAVEYNTAYHAAHVTDEAGGNVVVDVEVASWRPLTPQPTRPLWDDLLFLDGSRRVEARVLLEDGNHQAAFGALGSYGVGAVNCCVQRSRRAVILDDEGCLEVARICALGSGHDYAGFTIEGRLASQLGRLQYRVARTEERDVEAVVRKLQTEMREAEKRLASRLVDRFPNALIICDGPRPYLGGEANVVGYVKTIHQHKIGKAELEVVRQLEAGQRSPIYLVQDINPENYYFEWYLRLRDPRPWLYSLAGMVRLQAYAGPRPEAQLEAVRHLADWLCLTLPDYASRQHQDPRAPQQLLPVRALESELGRRMGHPQLIRRRITQYLSEQEDPS